MKLSPEELEFAHQERAGERTQWAFVLRDLKGRIVRAEDVALLEDVAIALETNDAVGLLNKRIRLHRRLRWGERLRLAWKALFGV
jgi:hypothetical protein